MTEITSELIDKLAEESARTPDICRSALEATGGDYNKALAELKSPVVPVARGVNHANGHFLPAGHSAVVPAVVPPIFPVVRK